MTHKKIFLIIIVFAALFTSCKKYLDVVPDNTLKLENIFDLKKDS